MAKTNFTKVEESLKSGMEKLQIKKIVDSTDKQLSEKEDLRLKRVEKKKIIFNLIATLKKLEKADSKFYTKIGTPQATIKKLLESPSKLNEEDWAKVLKLNDKIKNYLRVYSSALKEESNDELVEKEREKHVNKRFNIQEKWLPVD